MWVCCLNEFESGGLKKGEIRDDEWLEIGRSTSMSVSVESNLKDERRHDLALERNSMVVENKAGHI